MTAPAVAGVCVVAVAVRWLAARRGDVVFISAVLCVTVVAALAVLTMAGAR